MKEGIYYFTRRIPVDLRQHGASGKTSHALRTRFRPPMRQTYANAVFGCFERSEQMTSVILRHPNAHTDAL
ncbi:DUF6538 domain-containing protein [Phaeobacter sp. QD34_3]|uniref:DUF6538 domain-containing protein n=1 Tax=unclassified Phaeobacter TaxID=2621772 RepID=UPI00406C3A7B